MLVIGVRVTPSPADICRGHDPVKAITDCISCFIVRRNKHPSSVGMLYSDRAEPPSAVQTKAAAAGKLRENELRLAAGSVASTCVPSLARRALRVQPKVSNPLCSGGRK